MISVKRVSAGRYVAKHAGKEVIIERSFRTGLWITKHGFSDDAYVLFGPAFNKLSEAKAWAVNHLR